MELFFLSLSAFLTITALALGIFTSKKSSATKIKLPPGSFGWPIIGETIEFLYGKPEKFVGVRMKKYSPNIFKTKILGEKTAVICGPAGNKFLFANEQKLVVAWRPHAMQKLYRSYKNTASPSPAAPPSPPGNEMAMLRSPGFLKPQRLINYMGKMDSITQQHLNMYWEGRQVVEVFPVSTMFTLTLETDFLMGLQELEQHRIVKLVKKFDDLTFGQHSMALPLPFPGTAFYRAKKAAEVIRKELRSIIKDRKEALSKGNFTMHDVLSYMILAGDSSGRVVPENEIADKIMGLLTAGYNAVAMAITFFMKYVGERPKIYDRILSEQKEIAASKKLGEALNWEDMQKMKYSWNVVSEVMRLVPPLQGTFREAIKDFTYEGFTIPKGWKIYWTVSSTNKNPDYFPNPESFDPMRFEEANGVQTPYTYVPFGGGPRLCPGKEYARVAILTFVHHVVKRFKWEAMVPGEKIVGEMMPIPAQGLPILLQPHSI